MVLHFNFNNEKTATESQDTPPGTLILLLNEELVLKVFSVIVGSKLNDC
jgi:hypothetical protein